MSHIDRLCYPAHGCLRFKILEQILFGLRGKCPFDRRTPKAIFTHLIRTFRHGQRWGNDIEPNPMLGHLHGKTMRQVDLSSLAATINRFMWISLTTNDTTYCYNVSTF